MTPMSAPQDTQAAESQISPFDQVKAKVSLESYFGEKLGCDLRVEGAGRLACRCPWHEEKTPSLKINVDEGTFRCFGACDFGGSVIDAVMRQEDFEYPKEALEWLNQEYDLRLTISNAYWREFSQRIEKAQKKIEAAQAEMDDPKSAVAKAARDMLAARGLTEETWRQFGLVVDKDRGRLLIPIVEKGGHPYAWSGRALKETAPCQACGEAIHAKDTFNARAEAHSLAGHDRSPAFCKAPECIAAATRCPKCGAEKSVPLFLAGQFPKYSDSVGYEKNKTLYNFPGARKSLRAQKEARDKQPILVMEGFGDVWACHQSGYPGAVAYNGGSLTQIQAHEVAKAASQLGRWIGLVPDFDTTGRIKVHSNIKALREADPNADIRVLHGVDRHQRDDGKPCKDAGELLQEHGDSLLAEMLKRAWWSADEFKIREVLDGDWDVSQQIDLVNNILSEARHTISLDEIVPLLASRWGRDESVVRTFLHSTTSRGADLMDSARLVAGIGDAHDAAKAYLKEGFVITTDYDKINEALPGGGFRLRQLSMVLGKSGTGKTTLLANLLWQFVRRQELPCIFFSLEQPKGQVYITLTQVALGVTSKEAEDMILSDDARLEEVDRLFQHLVIVDNVPDDESSTTSITPAKIAQLIHEINLTRSEEPIKVVFIDHLGIVKADPDARGFQEADASKVAGIAMEEFFAICKQTNTFFMVLQQLGRDSEMGVELNYDEGRGASQQTDFCDYIITIWRPDQRKDLTDDEKIALAGQYKFKLGKNRHGPNNVIAHLTFDSKKRRITTETATGVPDGFMPDIADAEIFAGSDPLFGEPAEASPAAGLPGGSEDGPPFDAQPAGGAEDPPDWYTG